MNSATGWALSGDQARDYERFFVPAIFAQWARQVAAAAELNQGNSVLDVGCGTGILARIAKEEVGVRGRVTGLDRQDAMLDVARAQASDIEWRKGDAQNLPFADGTFERVVSQFALMFMSNRVTATKEMWRVLRPGGRLTMAVWARLERSEAYHKLHRLVGQFAGSRAAEVFAAPWALGKKSELHTLLRAAGLRDYGIETRRGSARYPSVDSMLESELRGTPVSGEMSGDQYENIRAIAGMVFASFRVASGEIILPLNAHIVTAHKK